MVKMAENDDELNRAIDDNRVIINHPMIKHGRDMFNHPAVENGIVVEKSHKEKNAINELENNEILLKFLQQVGTGLYLYPPAKKILMNWQNVLSNQIDCMVIYAIRKIGFIWKGKLVEFGIHRDSIQKSFMRLEEMGFIKPIDKEDIIPQLPLVFPSYQHFQQAKIKSFTKIGKILFDKVELDIKPAFKQKIDEFAQFLKSINPQEIEITRIERKIKRKRRKDPLFKYWEKLDEYFKRKEISNRTINANSIKFIGITPDKLRRLEQAKYIQPIQTPSVVKTFYVKTLKELEKEGIL